MVKVFISYRRADSQYAADRIYKRLTEHLGAGRVFRDVESISPGADFRRVLEGAVGQCDVLLAMIGPRWVEEAARRASHCDDVVDYVRLELEWGLGRSLRTIPLLVEGASMPKAVDLPLELEELVYHHALSIHPGAEFDGDVERLIKELDNTLEDIYSPLPSDFGAGEGLLLRLLSSLFPRAHLMMVQRGWASQPREMSIVHDYLEFFRGKMDSLNWRVHYIPLDGAEAPPLPPHEAVYAMPPSRSEVLCSIRREVRLLSGLSGGDQATAQLASLNRNSRVVRDVAKLLRRRSEPLILLGDPGSGKSTTVREAGLNIALAGLKSARPPVTIYVPLNKYKSARGDKPGTVWALIKKQLVDDEQFALLDLLPFLERAGRLVILFDGMDEMERQLYGARVALLSDFARLHRGVVKTLFACRTNDFSPKFIHGQLVLLEFNREQVEKYLLNNLRPLPIRIGSEVLEADRLASRLLGDSELNETARNPLTLSLLCRFLADRKEWPHMRRDLFEHYLHALFNSLRGKDGESLPESTWDAVFDGWARVAFRITVHHAGTTVELEELRREWGAETADTVTATALRCGLLVLDESDEQNIRFTHHRIQEYLTACFLDKYGAQQTELDWGALVDTPRWQEILINLASIQQERSEVLKVVLESMRSIIDDLDDGLGGLSDGDGRWRWPTAEERILADRVVLASRVIRELGENPSKLPPHFLETFTRSVARLADEGRPTAKVKMLWAWGNTANVCPLEALNTPLQSEVDWVRGQALSVVSGLSYARRRVDVDLRRELVIDLANGRLLRRLKAYREAIVKAGDRSLYFDLGRAAACELVYAFGLLTLLFAALFVALSLWPATYLFEPLSTGVSRGALAALLSALSASAAVPALRFTRLGLWRLTTYAGAALCSLLFLVERLTRVDSGWGALWALVEMAAMAGIALGVLTFGGRVTFWLKFGLNILPRLFREDSGHLQAAYRIARRNSSSDADQVHTQIFLWSAGVFTFGRLVGLVYGFLEPRVVVPANNYLDNLFNTTAWPSLFLLTLGVLYGLYRLCKALWHMYRKARDWRGGLGTSADASVRDGGAPAAKPSESPQAEVKAAPQLSKDDELGLLAAVGVSLGCGALTVLFVFLLIGATEGLRWLGLNLSSSRFMPFLILLVVAGLLPFGLAKLLRPILRPLGDRLTNQVRRRALLRMTADEWAWRVRYAGAEEQFRLLSQTHSHTVGLEPVDFLRLLEGLEEYVAREPAASQYWKTLHSLEEICRQERLPDTSALRADANAAPQVTPLTGAATVPRTEVQAGIAADAPTHGATAYRWIMWPWVLRALLPVAGAVVFAVAFNWLMERSRDIYVVNGLAEQVEVEIDGGEAFKLAPNSFERRVIAEGTHVVKYRAGQAELRAEEFKLSSGWFERFTDDKVYIVNLGGAAILRYCIGLELHGDEAVPSHPRYSVGETFVSFPRADHLMREVRIAPVGYVRASILQFSPELPSWVFERLPPAYSDARKMALAEERLRETPDNILLLSALGDFAAGRGHTQRYRDFLSSEMRRRLLPVEWYAHWHDLALAAEGAGHVAEVLDSVLEDTPRSRSVRLYLSARQQETLGEKLKYYAEAIQADDGNAQAWFGRCAALKNRGEFGAARDACRASLDRYRKVIGRNTRPGTRADQLVSPLEVLQRRDGLFATTWLEALDLDFALHDYEAAEKDISTAFSELANNFPVRIYRIALAALNGKPGEAHKFYVYYQGTGFRGPVPDAYFHYLLGEFDEQLHAAREIPEPGLSALMQANAQLELGDYVEVERQVEPLDSATRGIYLLLASVGVGALQERQPNRLWRRAEEEFRQFSLPPYRSMAELLASDSAPPIEKLVNVDLPPPYKATVLLALAQRFPELREDAFAAFDQFAYSPLPPGHFLRQRAQAAR